MFISMRLSRAHRGPWGLGLGMVLLGATTFAALWWWPSIGLSGDSRAFFDELDDADTRRWERSDGWSNGDWVGCSWRADNVVFDAGEMTLVLDDKGGRDHDHACGEYRTHGTYHYGRYEASMKAARGEGVVSAFFIYTGPAFDTAWHETTVEILGRDTSEVQFTLFVGGERYPSTVDLGFDAAEDFHTYAIEWAPDEVRWYVDDRLLHVDSAASQSVPERPGRIYVSVWNSGQGLEDWLGEFRYDGRQSRRPLTGSATPRSSSRTDRMRLAVCIATCRRPEQLGELLRALADVAVPDDVELVVVVVDNDPGESARATAERARERLRPPLHYVTEARPGVSFARNTALDATAGYDAIAFIDDDEVPGHAWLE